MFEILQRPDAKPLKKCVQCGGEVEKVITPPAIQFKGSGWYITDYAQKQEPSSKKEDSPQKESSGTEEKKPSEKTKDSSSSKKEPSSKKNTSSPSTK